jgi:2-amino-4-hydroxy-6-hydroxymethyldihydropteridine diphosphokinase
MSFHRAFIALGSNLENPMVQVTRAMDALGHLPHTSLSMRSSLYRTAPVGYLDQPDFINGVAEISTALSPTVLMTELLNLEKAFGRVREHLNGPRIIDLDLLLYDGEVLHESHLTLPHPRMHERAFVLVPLAEIAPQIMIPAHGTAQECLSRCDAGDVIRVEELTA